MPPNKGITDPLADQCGNCAYWDKSDRRDGNGECCGTPPTPILLGARENRFGQGVDFQMDNMRPVLAPNARPCALHKRIVPTMIGQKGH